ncbi:Fanconi anemia core complex-associated protein 24 [Chanos chanos]|uniref:Fanconi anemia core complex-associated protein 24 n=1 Tax=Chanos chanos TaxID=29144 RepID=A0A6J2UPE6_CHACN|nr:Fanconi anemia core complex-associated protein 24 [Chanos chanos]
MDSKFSPAILSNAVPPYGHVIANEKWRGSALVQNFKGNVKVIFEEEPGVVDFYLSNKSCIIYVSEGDLVAGNYYKRRIVRFRNANSSLQGIIIVEKTHLSEQYFPSMQKFVVLELGLTLLPVASQAEASQLIGHLALTEGKDNPFRRRSTSRLLEPVVLALVQQIPGVGKVKAQALLHQFSSIHQLSTTSISDLEPIVGQAAAQHIWGFFHHQLD